MYIKTKDALVNLRDKDIVIRRGYGFGDNPDPFLVMAEGPAGAFDSLNESYIRTEIELFRGTERDCVHYLNGLCRDMAELDAIIIDGEFETLTGYSPDVIEASESPQPDDEIPCEKCGAPLTGAGLVCPECGHDNIPF